MGRPSSIRRLPPDLREKLEAWLRDKRLTQVEAAALLNEFLRERELPKVSRQAVNRYARSMDKVGERMRQSKEMADSWIAKLGEQPSGRVGELVISMMTTLVYEINLKLQDAKIDEKSLPGLSRQLRELSLTAQRLQRAAQASADRELKIREEERKLAAEELARRVESEPGKSAGAERMREIAREMYGV
ncbi:MAG: DUF3486 family protein [Bryobacterales bacterium]|nr:DUF3486 family protein [Bryobacterales bacterium]